MSLAKKMMVLSVVISLLSIVTAAFSFYFFSIFQIEKIQGERMENTVRTATFLLDGDEHDKVLGHYQASHKRIKITSEFKKIRSLLKKIKRESNMDFDIFTLIRQKWAPKQALFLVSNDEKKVTGQIAPHNPLALTVFKTGIPRYTPLYEREEEKYLSAFAPIKNKVGRVVGVLQIDYNMSSDLGKVKRDIVLYSLAAFLVSVLLSLLLGHLTGKLAEKPILKLGVVMQRASMGNFSLKYTGPKEGEIGLLGGYFNDMIQEMEERFRKMEYYVESLERKLDSPDIRDGKLSLGIVRNLNQGVFVFDREGRFYPVYSDSCVVLFEKALERKYMWELLPGDEKELRQAITGIFNAPFDKKIFKEDCFNSLPDSLEERKILYKPLLDNNKKLHAVMGIVGEKSVQNKENVGEYLWDIRNVSVEIKRQLTKTTVLKPLIKRYLFFIKQYIERCGLDELEKTISVFEEKLDHGEDPSSLHDYWITMEEQIKSIFKTHGMDGEQDEVIPIPRKNLHSFQKMIRDKDLRYLFARDVSAVSLEKYFSTYGKMAASFAQSIRKKIDFSFINGDIKVDGLYYENLISHFIHVFLNMVEFSLETPSIRLENGKKETGRIVVKFNVDGDYLHIIVRDDGKGIDPSEIKNKLQDVANKNDQEILQYVFHEDFSLEAGLFTGMHDFFLEVRRLGGNMIVQSSPGKSCILLVRVPYVVEMRNLEESA